MTAGSARFQGGRRWSGFICIGARRCPKKPVFRLRFCADCPGLEARQGSLIDPRTTGFVHMLWRIILFPQVRRAQPVNRGPHIHCPGDAFGRKETGICWLLVTGPGVVVPRVRPEDFGIRKKPLFIGFDRKNCRSFGVCLDVQWAIPASILGSARPASKPFSCARCGAVRRGSGARRTG